jgi:nitronate monooxygenase
MAMHPLLGRLGLTVPVLQAPMAGTSTPALACAVSNAGGLGSIALGHIDVDAASADIAQVRAGTNRAFGVNVFCHAPAVRDRVIEARWLARLAPEFAKFGAPPPAELHEIYRSFIMDRAKLDLLVETRAPVVSFHFGLPPPEAIAALKRAGSVLLATATNPREADAAVAAGVDAIIAQGHEAGGHRGVFDEHAPDEQLGTAALVRRLTARLDAPVIAAGGIMDGAGIAAALALGAVAVQMGTAFIASPEAAPDDAHRAALLKADARATVVTRAISGRPARCLVNRFTTLEPILGEPPSYPVAYDAGKALSKAAKARGEAGYGAWWAGRGAPLARAAPAARLIDMLSAELKASGGGDDRR